MNLGEALERIIQGIGGPFATEPVIIPGLTLGGAYAANDAFGTLFWFDNVPKKGVLHAVIFYDRDNEKLGKELFLSPYPFTPTANDAAFAPSANDLIRGFTVRISASDFGTGFNANAIGMVSNLGIPYAAPKGRLWCQVVTRGADNIASGSEPLVTLVIL